MWAMWPGGGAASNPRVRAAKGWAVRRVCFVDDERAILDGLRQVLRRERKAWDMEFHESGPSALDAMRRAPFDLILTDMRMPGMDGARLLEVVSAEFPATGRVVLSGQAEDSALLRASRVAHRFLAKPCEVSQLRATLADWDTLFATFDRGARLGLHPAASRLAIEPDRRAVIVHELARGHIAEAVREGERSPAFVARVLQLVSSGWYGAERTVGSIAEAVRVMGPDLLVRAVADLPDMDGAFASHEASWPAPTVVFALAEAMSSTSDTPECLTAAAWVSDLGARIALAVDPSTLAACARALQQEYRPREEVERECLGATVTEIGAMALAAWRTPGRLVGAVRAPGPWEGGDRRLSAVLAAARALAEEAGRAAGRQDLIAHEIELRYDLVVAMSPEPLPTLTQLRLLALRATELARGEAHTGLPN